MEKHHLMDYMFDDFCFETPIRLYQKNVKSQASILFFF